MKLRLIGCLTVAFFAVSAGQQANAGCQVVSGKTFCTGGSFTTAPVKAVPAPVKSSAGFGAVKAAPVGNPAAMKSAPGIVAGCTGCLKR